MRSGVDSLSVPHLNSSPVVVPGLDAYGTSMTIANYNSLRLHRHLARTSSLGTIKWFPSCSVVSPRPEASTPAVTICAASRSR